MIPKIIHFTVPNSITNDQRRIIDRARELHPTWQFMVWQDPVDIHDFRLAKYHSKANSGAQLADLIRLDAIYIYGGIYLDSDVYLKRDLEPLLRQQNFFCSEDGQHLTNAVFAATARNELIGKLIDDLLENEPDWKEPPNITTGPIFFSNRLKWCSEVNILPRETFYPYNWNEKPVEPPVTCYGVHEWAGSWVQKKQDEEARKEISHRPSRVSQLLKKIALPVIDKIIGRIAEKIESITVPTITAYYQGGDLIVKTSRGIMLSVAGNDLSITPSLALNGTYEESELRFLERVLRGGDVFVDVGSNVGVFSLVAARRVGPFGRVFAYDANPVVLEHLNRSLVMNWMHERCIVKHRAVGEIASQVTLKFSAKRLGDGNIGLKEESSFHKSNQRLGDLHELHVDMVCLDDEFPFDQEIKILKIDVEGFEYGVIKGAQRLIRNHCVKYILMELLEEVAGAQHSNNVNAVNWMIEHGYRLGHISSEGSFIPSRDNKVDRKTSRNIVLMRVE